MLGRTLPFMACFALFGSGSPTHAYTSSDTPPQGVRAAGLVYGFARSVDSSLDEKGSRESLSAPMNRTVTIDDFAASEPRLNDLRAALNSIEPGLGENLLHANLYGDVKVNQSHFVSGLLWGITDRVSMGLIIPVIQRQVKVKFHSEVTNNAAAIQSRLGNVPELSNRGLGELANRQIDDETFIDSVFLQNGYQRPKDFKATTLGDSEIESRYRYYNTKRMGLALRGRVQMPTTQHKPDVTNIVDKDMDEGNWALKAAAIEEFRLIPEHLDISTSLWGIWRAPHKRTMAFTRKDSRQSVPNLKDPYQIETVERQRGAQLDFNLGFNLAFFRQFLNFMGTYSYTMKQSDRIYGQRELDYSSWTSNTNTRMHGVEGGIELSTIGLYLKKKFPAPGRISFSWFQPVSGSNGYYAPYGRFDLVLLF
jgi:hypothetical protein